MQKAEIYTPKQVASALNLNYRTILSKISKGELKTIRIGKNFLVTHAALTEYLNKSTESTQPLKIAVAIIMHNDKVLVLHRRVREGALSWQFPAGRIKYKERSSTRAEIECLEETGVHCKAVKSIGKRIHPDTKAIISYWLCEYLHGEPYLADDEENVEVRWVTKKQALKLFTSNVYPPVRKLLEV